MTHPWRIFASINGESRNRIAKLDATPGAVDATFNPGADAVVEAIETDGTSLWVGGSFETLAATTNPHLGKLDATNGTPDASWTAFTNNFVNDIDVVDSDIYVAGDFTKIGPFSVDGNGALDSSDALTVDRVARASSNIGFVATDPNGVDADWNPVAQLPVYEIDALPDGSNGGLEHEEPLKTLAHGPQRIAR